MLWTQDNEIKLSYLSLLSKEHALTVAMREEKEVLENRFTEVTGERFPGTVKGRIASDRARDDYSTYYKKREQEYESEERTDVNLTAFED